MAVTNFASWLEKFAGSQYIWYVKRLSANDTLANNTHQAGPYLPKEFLFGVFPSLNQVEVKNPDFWFELNIDSHRDQKKVRAIWYNNKFHENPKGGRNEARITNFGGASSALLDPENTGALAVFSFLIEESGNAKNCNVWVCKNVLEESLIEDRVGPIDPGGGKAWALDKTNFPDFFGPEMRPRISCWLEPNEIPASWLAKFPTGAEIIRKTLELRIENGKDPDTRLLKRRKCEFEIFRSLEEAVELPLIKKGFEGIEDFVARAQTILQRRKARSGRSLELHVREIFLEEGMKDQLDFSHQPESEAGKKPDFLFPSANAYKDSGFPDSSLRMLAVKTTCKDRWRQILTEADRIPKKHLLTSQEGVSEGQFREMTKEGVVLVVPTALIKNFPKSIQSNLQTFGGFLKEISSIKNIDDE